MRLTVGKKLGLGFGLVIVLLLAVAGVGFFSSFQAGKNIESVNEMTVDTALGADATAAMLNARMKVKEYLISNDPEDLAEYNQWAKKFKEAKETSRNSFRDPARLELVDRIDKDFKAYDATFAQVQQIIQERNVIRADVLDVVGKRAVDTLKTEVYDLFAAGRPDEAESLMPVILDTLEGRLYVMKFMRTSGEGDYQRAHDELVSAGEKLAAALPGISDPKIAETLASAQADIAEYDQAFSRVHDLVLERDRLVLETLDKTGPEIAKLQHDIQDSLVADGEKVTKQAKSAVVTAEYAILAVSSVAVLIGVVAALFITRLIVRPVRATLGCIEAIGQGDLTQEVGIKQKDELGELAQGVNGMTRTMRDLLGDVQGASHEVAGAATELSANAEQMSTSMQDQTGRMQQINAAVEEMGRAVVDIAQKAVSASETASKAGQSASEGGEVVSQTIEGMEAISAAVSASASSVQELGKRGEQIGQIIATINDIADQTNLLALNAAIEAARAGEHGRGFAVVADEVRKLADRTTSATEEIAESIQAIQQETGDAVDRMSAGTEQVKEGVQRAELAGQSLQSIVANASDVAGMIHSIAAATEEQSATAEQINRAVAGADSSIREAAEGSEQASIAVLSLSQKAEELQSMIGRFKLRD
ncbi:MAG: methyl-accepting chemotaxis protein [Planctomycetota bacterium]